MGKLMFELVWFDSLGAKSSCILLCIPDASMLIDPGAAVMQPSFPATWAKKLYWLAKAELAIRRAAKRADVIVISHHHYDHFTDFDRKLYGDKLLLVKNPNEYINDSQRGAERFFDNIFRSFGDVGLDEVLCGVSESRTGIRLKRSHALETWTSATIICAGGNC